MNASKFLLHYPDGEVTDKIRDFEKPDAFLLPVDSGVQCWVYTRIPRRKMTYDEADKLSHQVKIAGKSCQLLSRSQVRFFIEHLDEINELFQQLNIMPMKANCYFWARESNGKHKCGYKQRGKKAVAFIATKEYAIALAIPGIDDRILREKLALREKESKPNVVFFAVISR
ncbi:MAG: hypothetical protein J6W96_03205 [Alphaproteobacteria bacterium]|nr:hypothetical protein [Alphaproteobacteria bacterium]